MQNPIIRPVEVVILEAAVQVLADIHERGYVDVDPTRGGPLLRMAEILTDITTVYAGCLEA